MGNEAVKVVAARQRWLVALMLLVLAPTSAILAGNGLATLASTVMAWQPGLQTDDDHHRLAALLIGLCVLAFALVNNWRLYLHFVRHAVRPHWQVSGWIGLGVSFLGVQVLSANVHSLGMVLTLAWYLIGVVALTWLLHRAPAG